MIDTIVGFISNIFNQFWGQPNILKRHSENELNHESEAPRKRMRMEQKATGSSYFPNIYVRNSESQTDDDIDIYDKFFKTSPTISLLDDSTDEEKENFTRKKAIKKVSPFKNKYRPPKHCKSPLKYKSSTSSCQTYNTESDNNDVQFIGTIPDTKATNLLVSNNSKRPLLKRLSETKTPFSSRAELLVNRSLKKSPTSFFNPMEGQGRREYGLLLGSVLQSPELFKPSENARRKLMTAETIDLTKDDHRASRLLFKKQSIPPCVDLTGSTSKIKSKVEEVAKPQPFKIPPVNSLASKLRHEPRTSPSYVRHLLDDLNKFKMDFKQSETELLTQMSTFSLFNKPWQKALDERVKRHLKITEAIIDLDEEEEEEEPKLPELTQDMLETVENAWDSKKSQSQVLVSNFNYQIRRSDLLTLHKLNWLNDEVINFYMQLILERGKEEGFPSVYTFNTFFYPKLAKDGHASLKRWTRKVDIFSYEIIIVPIHLQIHWCLASINFKEKKIKYYDSMGHPNQKCLNLLLQYLKDEMVDKKQEKFDDSEWKLLNMKDIPQQMNSCDCGVFACTFAEYISRKAKFIFSQKDMPYFRKKMTYEIISSRLLKF